MKSLVPAIAKAFGGEAKIEIQDGAPITYNDPALTAQMVPTLERVLGKAEKELVNAVTGAEDFSYSKKEIPGFYFLGGTPLDVPESEAPSHHTPGFLCRQCLLATRSKSDVGTHLRLS